ncbi:MAG TPA: gamma-glutamyltransferase family protein [Chloroflexota bacterium]|nr:gamma-glutamyltransferase family protein [Chloroflexota bacterium]
MAQGVREGAAGGVGEGAGQTHVDSHGAEIGEVGLQRPARARGGFATRPVLQGTLGMVAAGHYLASAIGLRLLEQGGNAVDAGVAAGLALAVLKPQSNGIGGEVPILIHLATGGRTVAINGQGWAPQRATIGWFRERQLTLIPGDGFLPATVPAAFGSWCTALLRFGTASLTDVLGPAVELASGGFPVYGALHDAIANQLARFKDEWPTTAAIYLTGGQPPAEGTLLRNPDWARTMRGALDAAVREQARGREAAIQAALDFFYKGAVAEQAVGFSSSHAFPDASGQEHTGLFVLEDWADYGTRGTQVEAPVSVTYRGLDVFKCGPWCQGPVLLQQLKLLEGYDLQRLGHNSAEYVHLYLEAAKLAFADRERYYGDPAFVPVPLERLLADDYAALRRGLIDPQRASAELRPGVVGVGAGDPAMPSAEGAEGATAGSRPVYTGDTTHVDAVDRWGNLFAATPSGGWFQSSPVIEGLGFPLGTRGQMFYLDERHANALMPRKRPRTTLTPSLARRGASPGGGPRSWLAFGTPGGDQQDQWTLQFLLNVVDFGMDLQEAIDAPTVHTSHFPGSFYPHRANPNRCHVEGRIPSEVRRDLQAKGHEVVVDGDWSHGQVTAVAYDPATGVLSGAASPRGRTAYVMGR